MQQVERCFRSLTPRRFVRYKLAGSRHLSVAPLPSSTAYKTHLSFPLPSLLSIYICIPHIPHLITMISLTRVLVSFLAIASSVFASPIKRTGDPAINLPTAWTQIAPGANFSFSYNSLGDYGRSSYAYHVWLLADDAMDKPLSPTTLFSNGYFFGRFDFANYPGKSYFQQLFLLLVLKYLSAI